MHGPLSGPASQPSHAFESCDANLALCSTTAHARTLQAATPVASVDICVAVATERGLVTPIVKNADKKSVAAISAEVRRLLVLCA